MFQQKNVKMRKIGKKKPPYETKSYDAKRFIMSFLNIKSIFGEIHKLE